jgi:hypothetical protein
VLPSCYELSLASTLGWGLRSPVLNSGWFGYGSVGAVGFRWWQFGSNSLGWHVQFAALHFVHVVTSLEFAGGGSCSPSRCGHKSAWNCLWCTVARLMNLTSANLVCNSAALWVPCGGCLFWQWRSSYAITWRLLPEC